jgi:hypothetical protein
MKGRNQQNVDALSRASIVILITTDQIKKAQNEAQMTPNERQITTDGIVSVKRRGVTKYVGLT